ncbi:hypothetical protein HRR80_008285 [Exophiala dermatitidis]|uniref:Uncharacterized protein n=1 Tax=Exophiala dermatitidis TaxID=5970 RepID=A0AAN6ELT5_EXODE|nr:hypothetical protein HRR80_008285 [Exophiala dermatitidis]
MVIFATWSHPCLSPLAEFRTQVRVALEQSQRSNSDRKGGQAVQCGTASRAVPVLDMAILGRCINGVFLFNAVSLRFPWFLNSDSRFLASSLLLPHRTMSYATAHPRTGTQEDGDLFLYDRTKY